MCIKFVNGIEANNKNAEITCNLKIKGAPPLNYI